jgi:molybdopterin synthase catalytic subunit
MHQFLLRDCAKESLDANAALDFVSDPSFGGITQFVGKVRAINHGREVLGVSYDIFQPLALTRFAEIAAEIEATLETPVKIHISHAFGRLGIGDIAVVVAAGSKHRDEAFQACRMAIEAVKHSAPIWKQEHFSDGDSVWSEGCSLCETHTHDEQHHSHK